MHSEQELKHASEFREEIHKEALAKARASYPEIEEVVDKHPAQDYFTEHWDYPGMWYTVPGVPEGYKSRQVLVDEIARATIDNYLQTKTDSPKEAFWEVIADYPDCVVDYAIVSTQEPYLDYESHFEALMKGALTILGEDWKLNFNLGKITAKRISPQEFLAPADEDGKLNYRKAFLYPPYPNNYTEADFEGINALLFPNGTDCLDIFKWSTDWSDYFDEGNEWWGTLCLTVYDSSLNRFVVIMASATD